MGTWMKCLAAVIAATLSLADAAAQAYPTKPVRLLVGFAAGGPSDILSRRLADRLGPRLGQPVVVENRTGAGGAIAAQAVAQAEPDGHLLYQAGASVTALRVFNRDLRLDVRTDLAAVAKYADTVVALIGDTRLPVRTLGELVSHAKANPGKLNYGTAGGAGFLAMENLKRLAGVDIVHVQYKGATEYAAALLGGQIQMILDLPASHIGNIEAGKVRVLAIFSKTRSAAHPGVPTVAESGFANWVYDNWNAVFAPGRTPRAVIERLAREIVAIAGSEEFRVDLAGWSRGSYVPSPAGPEELASIVARDVAQWEEVAKFARIQ